MAAKNNEYGMRFRARNDGSMMMWAGKKPPIEVAHCDVCGRRLKMIKQHMPRRRDKIRWYRVCSLHGVRRGVFDED